MNRIALNSRASTKGWPFDDAALDDKLRWSRKLKAQQIAWHCKSSRRKKQVVSGMEY